MYGYYEIEAEDEEEAEAMTEDLPLPDGEFLSDSFEIDEVTEIDEKGNPICKNTSTSGGSSGPPTDTPPSSGPESPTTDASAEPS